VDIFFWGGYIDCAPEGFRGIAFAPQTSVPGQGYGEQRQRSGERSPQKMKNFYIRKYHIFHFFADIG